MTLPLQLSAALYKVVDSVACFHHILLPLRPCPAFSCWPWILDAGRKPNHEDTEVSPFSSLGGGGGTDCSDGVLLVFVPLYFLSSLSLFCFHHSSASCAANFRLLSKLIYSCQYYFDEKLYLTVWCKHLLYKQAVQYAKLIISLNFADTHARMHMHARFRVVQLFSWYDRQ